MIYVRAVLNVLLQLTLLSMVFAPFFIPMLPSPYHWYALGALSILVIAFIAKVEADSEVKK